jgi:hypothetical protein
MRPSTSVSAGGAGWGALRGRPRGGRGGGGATDAAAAAGLPPPPLPPPGAVGTEPGSRHLGLRLRMARRMQRAALRGRRVGRAPTCARPAYGPGPPARCAARPPRAGCVDRLPMWLAPNLITLTGTIGLVIAYCVSAWYSPDFAGATRSWAGGLGFGWGQGRTARRPPRTRPPHGARRTRVRPARTRSGTPSSPRLPPLPPRPAAQRTRTRRAGCSC